MGEDLTHIDEAGRAKMVDVGAKDETEREGVAEAIVRMQPATLERIRAGQIKKGDVLAVAQVAGVMGAKKTPELIPMCHPIAITGVDFNFEIDDEASTITITASVRTIGRTGVEMEALTAVATAALTIYDMCKAIDKGMIIDGIALVKKSGGRSGLYERA
ncbi:hypothetical protein LCGC14_3110910 [marine sediment metagenome]|uniref:cyclic pyranopterin monophosphate synthase n=1 Tax=marine sediment metagenome TaxID=412755 RepID=A0A0F8YV09_9ZZZZ